MSAKEGFAKFLREQLEAAGRPSLRTLEELTKETGRLVSRSRLGDMLSGRSLPSWEVTLAFLRAIKADDLAVERAKDLHHALMFEQMKDRKEAEMRDASEKISRRNESVLPGSLGEELDIAKRAIKAQAHTFKGQELDAPPIRAFLSYARSDDDEFGFISPLASQLKAFVRVKSGRHLELFVDRESIEWGDDWRGRLESAVQEAALFIPIVTATYLSRSYCRDEFLAFVEKAKILGVTDLVLPLLLVETDLITPASSDPVARELGKLQNRNIEDSFLAGYESADWRRKMAELASDILKIAEKTEIAVAATVESDASLHVVEDDDHSGIVELMGEFQTAVEDMESLVPELTSTFERLGQATSVLREISDMRTPRQFQGWALKAAKAFEPHTLDIEKYGRRFQSDVMRMDGVLRDLKVLVRDIPEFRESFENSLDGIAQQFSEMDVVEEQMEELLAMLGPAENMSAPLRRSLRPMRYGLTALRDGLRLMRSWKADLQ